MLSLYQDLCSKAPSLKSPCSSLPGQQSRIAPLPLCLSLSGFWGPCSCLLSACILWDLGAGVPEPACLGSQASSLTSQLLYP